MTPIAAALLAASVGLLPIVASGTSPRPAGEDLSVSPVHVDSPAHVDPDARATSGTAPDRAVPRGSWDWPLRPTPAVVRRFERPPTPWASGHRGVDLLGRAAQTVRAAGPGVVSFSGVVAGRGVVTVRHAGGWRTTYEPVGDRPETGTRVSRGDTIGSLRATASHCAPRICLHWGALADPRDYRDPLALLGLVPPVLLPLTP